MFPREPTAAKDKKASVVTVLQRQREVKDWRSMLHQRKEQEQQRMAVNSEVQQLKEAKSDLVMKEMENGLDFIKFFIYHFLYLY